MSIRPMVSRLEPPARLIDQHVRWNQYRNPLTSYIVFSKPWRLGQRKSRQSGTGHGGLGVWKRRI